jgi:antitoxin component of RelBE/YafQ-DinJ toxin-antitoxin module
MTESDCNRIESSINALSDRLGAMQLDMSQRLTRLENQVANEGALCPFRETIARAGNNVKRLEITEARIDHVEDKIHALEVQYAKAGIITGAAGGGAFTVIGGIIFAVGKAAGWW